jgi:hypothetical protein
MMTVVSPTLPIVTLMSATDGPTAATQWSQPWARGTTAAGGTRELTTARRCLPHFD